MTTNAPAVTPETLPEKVESITAVDSPWKDHYVLTASEVENMTASQMEEFVSVQGDLYDIVTGDMTANVTDRAAYATHYARQKGLIAGGPVEGKPVYTYEEYVRKFYRRKSKSLVNGWTILGTALEVVGLTTSDPVYIALRNSNAYGEQEVIDAVKHKDATRESIALALEPFANLSTGHRLTKEEKDARALQMKQESEKQAAQQAEAERAAHEAESIALLLAAGKSEEEAAATIAEVREQAEKVAAANAEKVAAATGGEVPSESPEQGDGDALARLYLATGEVRTMAEALTLDDWVEWSDALTAWIDSQKKIRTDRLTVKPSDPSKRAASKRAASK